MIGWLLLGAALGFLVGNVLGVVVYVSLVERGVLVPSGEAAALLASTIVLASTILGALAALALAR